MLNLPRASGMLRLALLCKYFKLMQGQRMQLLLLSSTVVCFSFSSMQLCEVKYTRTIKKSLVTWSILGSW